MKPPGQPVDNNNSMAMMDDANHQGLTQLLLPELRQEVFRYLNSNDLAELSCVAQQFRKECRDDALPQYRTAVIRYRPVTNNNALSSAMGCHHSLHPLVGALLKIPTKHDGHAFAVFEERFPRLQVQGVSQLPKINNREAKPIAKDLKLPQITHLDLSSPVEYSHNDHAYPQVAPSIARLLTQIVPQLEELDLSYNHVSTAVLADAARNCPKLERMRLVEGLCGGVASATGVDWKNCHALRELILDNTLLQASSREAMDMFQDPDKTEVCPLRYCLDHLERVSLKACRYYDRLPKQATKTAMMVSEPFTQLGLIKLVRNAPNLRWFRSDLTPDNVQLLQDEFPDIEFVE